MVNPTVRSPIQELSKLAFGHDHRLTLARELLARAPAFADVESLHLATKIPTSSLNRELRELEQLGVVTRRRGTDRVEYALKKGGFWEWCQELLIRE